MELPIEQLPRVRAYRRLAAGFSIASGIAVGTGLGALAALAGSPWPILGLGLPLGIRAFGTISGRLTFRDPTIAWLWPLVALVVAVPLAVGLPAGLASVGLGIAVVLWFATLVVGGILDVIVDPEGRLGL